MPVQFFFGKANGLALRHGLERQARRLVGNIAPDGKHQFARRGKPGSSFLSVLEVVSPPDAFGDDIHVAVDLILVDDNFICLETQKQGLFHPVQMTGSVIERQDRHNAVRQPHEHLHSQIQHIIDGRKCSYSHFSPVLHHHPVEEEYRNAG